MTSAKVYKIGSSMFKTSMKEGVIVLKSTKDNGVFTWIEIDLLDKSRNMKRVLDRLLTRIVKKTLFPAKVTGISVSLDSKYSKTGMYYWKVRVYLNDDNPDTTWRKIESVTFFSYSSECEVEYSTASNNPNNPEPYKNFSVRKPQMFFVI